MSEELGTQKNGKAKHPAGPVPRHLGSELETAVATAATVDPKSVDPQRYLPKLVIMRATIQGVSPLIVENFDKKTRDMLLEKHKGHATGKKGAKDVDALFLGSKYLDGQGRDCFPCGPIRAAMIGAARIVDSESMATLKQAIFIENPTDRMSDLIPLEFSRCEQREDATRNANGQPDIRIRACYYDWKLSFVVKAVQNVLSTEKLLELLAHAGLGGLGGWRPSGKKGIGGVYGRFEIADIQ